MAKKAKKIIKSKEEPIYIPRIPLNWFKPMPKKARSEFTSMYAKAKKAPTQFEFEDIHNFVELCNLLEMTPGQMASIIMRLVIMSAELST